MGQDIGSGQSISPLAKAQVVEAAPPSAAASASKLAEAAARALGNPLAVIVGRADMIVSGEAAGKHDIRASAEIILEQATRLERLVEELRLFGLPPKPDPVRTDLFALAREVLAEVAEKAWASRLRTQVVCESRDAAWAHVDPEHAKEALRRVVQNATEAMKDGGELAIDVARKRWQSHVQKSAPEKEWVRLLIRDAGPGIPEAARKRLFEPFFTTKPWSDGLGLGLPIARRLVAANDGFITVGSAVDVGTIVRIYLPPSPVR
jgi:signal transduction histidine kinase